MAKPTFEIRFPDPASPDLMNRALNFIEDVYREVTELGIAEVSGIDNYGNGRFTVVLTQKRERGRLQDILVRFLSGHNLTHDAVVSRTDIGKDTG